MQLDLSLWAGQGCQAAEGLVWGENRPPYSLGFWMPLQGAKQQGSSAASQQQATDTNHLIPHEARKAPHVTGDSIVKGYRESGPHLGGQGPPFPSQGSSGRPIIKPGRHRQEVQPFPSFLDSICLTSARWPRKPTNQPSCNF